MLNIYIVKDVPELIGLFILLSLTNSISGKMMKTRRLKIKRSLDRG